MKIAIQNEWLYIYICSVIFGCKCGVTITISYQYPSSYWGTVSLNFYD